MNADQTYDDNLDSEDPDTHLFLFCPLLALGGSFSSSLFAFLVSPFTTFRLDLLMLFPALSSLSLLLLFDNKKTTRTLAGIHSDLFLSLSDDYLQYVGKKDR